jgi:hypothetical protein
MTNSADSFRNRGFTDDMINAFIHYVANVYPEGINACKLLDPLARCIAHGKPATNCWPDEESLQKLDDYCQQEERDQDSLQQEWSFMDVSGSNYTSELSTIFYVEQ